MTSPQQAKPGSAQDDFPPRVALRLDENPIVAAPDARWPFVNCVKGYGFNKAHEEFDDPKQGGLVYLSLAEHESLCLQRERAARAELLKELALDGYFDSMARRRLEMLYEKAKRPSGEGGA